MKRIYGLLVLVLVTWSSCGVLWSGRGERRIISAPEAPPAELLTSFSFRQLTGGIILVQAGINDYKDTLNFILDTGSGGISLDSATVKKLGLKTTPSDAYVRGLGGKVKLNYACNNTLVLPGLTVDSLDFYINDYSFLSSVYGLHVDGIIGYAFLKDKIVYINYDEKEIRVYTPGRYIYPKNGWLLQPHPNNIPFVTASVRNKFAPVQNHYYFDIGAGLNILLSDRLVEDSSLFEHPKQRRHKFVEAEIYGFSGKLDMIKTVIGRVMIGPYRFRKVPVYLFNDANNVLSYPFIAGLVGNDLLRRFNVTLNYPQGEIFLLPNSNFREAFDYSYTGLTLNLIEGEVVIVGVTEHSPARKAGFEEGDIILAIDGDFSHNIQAYHKHLKGVGKVVKILLLRDGEPLQKRLKVKSIL